MPWSGMLDGVAEKYNGNLKTLLLFLGGKNDCKTVKTPGFESKSLRRSRNCRGTIFLCITCRIIVGEMRVRCCCCCCCGGGGCCCCCCCCWQSDI